MNPNIENENKTEILPPNALKHGAYSKILILPFEDPDDFENLKDSLFAEFKPSGPAEESTIRSIAKAMWQVGRLDLYEHVSAIRARASSIYRATDSRLKQYVATERAVADESSLAGLQADAAASKDENDPNQKKKKSSVELLLEFGDFLSASKLSKDLDLEIKLQSKLDRLFRRFFQIKAMKQIAGLSGALEEPSAPKLVPPASSKHSQNGE